MRLETARISIVRLGFVLGVLTTGCITTAAADADDSFRRQVLPLLQNYCFTCHDDVSKEAGIDLSSLAGRGDVVRNLKLWKTALVKLQRREMPPEEADQPSEAEREMLSGWILDATNNVNWQRYKHPGPATPARLTRVEYTNTVRDLFGVTVDIDSILTADPEGPSGFANDRTSLLMTPTQLRQYLDAAELVAATVRDTNESSNSVRIHYEVETGENEDWHRTPKRDADGTAGWLLKSNLATKYQGVKKPLAFPLTGTYRVRIRAKIEGPGREAGMYIALDNLNDISSQPGILVSGNNWKTYETTIFVTAGQREVLFGYDFYRPAWLAEPSAHAPRKLPGGTFDPPKFDRKQIAPRPITRDEISQVAGFQLPDNEGEIYKLRTSLADLNGLTAGKLLDAYMKAQHHYLHGFLPVLRPGGTGEVKEAARLIERISKLSGVRREDMESLWELHTTEEFRKARADHKNQLAAWEANRRSRQTACGDLLVDWMEFEGPLFSTEDSVMRISFTESTESRRQESVRKILQSLLPKAFRRPLDEQDVNRYASFYSAERTSTDHEIALQRTLIAVLMSPSFLYRMDFPRESIQYADVRPDDKSGVAPLNDHQVAARLSYFLWSSPPDERLRKSANDHALTSKVEIRAQVDRMLDDDRSHALASQFTEQWLDLSGIGREKQPDAELFRQFSRHLANDFRAEVALLFLRVLREDRSLLELLNSEETFVNERLARLYGIEHVAGPDMQLVTVPDARRGGLLGTGAVLTTTSLATRTSPVRRGAFVLEKLLGIELPPPPPDAGQLPDDAGRNTAVSIRQQLALHRRHSQCNGCHSKIDPLGFALENFDFVGRWRTRDSAGPIDSSASIPDGTIVGDVQSLKKYLVNERKEEFVRSITEAMLRYALGRELDYYDEYAIREILSALKKDQHRGRTLIREIASCYPFLCRSTEPILK